MLCTNASIKFMRRIRIQIGEIILLSGHMRGGETAEHCGFNSIYSFSRCF